MKVRYFVLSLTFTGLLTACNQDNTPAGNGTDGINDMAQAIEQTEQINAIAKPLALAIDNGSIERTNGNAEGFVAADPQLYQIVKATLSDIQGKYSNIPSSGMWIADAYQVVDLSEKFSVASKKEALMVFSLPNGADHTDWMIAMKINLGSKKVESYIVNTTLDGSFQAFSQANFSTASHTSVLRVIDTGRPGNERFVAVNLQSNLLNARSMSGASLSLR